MTVRVLLVDDQALFRAGIAMIISTQPDLELAGECSSGEEAIRYLRDHADVDVVLMDVQMPGLGGIAATATITQEPHAPRVLVLTTFDDDQAVVEALTAGASGFILKDARAEMLLAAVRSVAEGTAVLARSASLRQIAARATTRGDPPAALNTLTPGERNVFQHAAMGMNNREVAAAVFLSETTVKSYLSRVLLKLGLRDRVQLVLFAVRHGLID